MNKKYNILLSFFLFVFETSVFAYDFEVDGIYYNILSHENNTVEVTNFIYYGGTMTGTNLYNKQTIIHIPASVEHNQIAYNVTSIGDYAFANCYHLTTITIPNSITSINEGAFYNCKSLTSVTLPQGVTKIGGKAFCNCESLTSVTLGNYIEEIENEVFYECRNLTSITIPRSVFSIGDRSFYGCSSLTSVIIPDSVTDIKDNAFYNCTNLSSVKFGCCLENIGAFCFNNCSHLTSLTIPNSVKEMGSGAFKGCSSLTSLVIGSGINDLNSAFSGCSSLTTITSLNASPPISSGFDDVVYNTAILYIPQGRKTSYINATGWGRFINIEENSTFINSIIEVDGFYYYITSSDNRTVGVFPKENDHYSGDYSGDVVIPQTFIYNEILYRVTSIGESAFFQCFDLTSVTIPDGVTLIDHWAFENCFNLTSVTLPSSVESIEYWAFGGCKSLSSIPLGSNIKFIGRQAFYNCTNLTSITIPNSVVSIHNSAFEGCKGLSTVILHCKDVGRWFYNIKKLFLGNEITSIEDYAFYSSDILEVISEIEKPFNLVETTFSYKTYTNATLYVPKGTIDKYKATEGWKKFFNIVEGSPSGISNIENEGVKELKRYTLDGRVIKDSYKGLNIIQMKNGTTKKVLSK